MLVLVTPRRGFVAPPFNNFSKMIKAERPLFKIWDKRNEKYVSGDKSKTTWRSEKWVVSKLNDLCNSHWNKRDINDFDIRVFELQLTEVQPASALFEPDQKKREFKRVNKEIVTRMRTKIQEVFPDINIWQIRELYNKKIINTQYIEQLKPLMDNLVQAERNS